MRHSFAFASCALLLMTATAASAEGPSLDHKIDVPPQFRSGQSQPAFNWQSSDIARYIEGYERMWQACIEMSARDIDAVNKCPAFCSGNVPATAGCVDGAAAINKRLTSDIRRFGTARVRSFLRESLGMQENR
jgi:hypothetical protein